ncbi:hypothetical protein NQ318_002531 [Aromia moschata]|uniref:Uncharacterized protein n=1 Tax=Aromia moschata TaxID=1265417 RepID=A0AAV8Y3Z5_9CUCU|nr:hypothetical protein NQ318_002531 [Aromia moschata]
MDEYGFELRQWMSNEQSIVDRESNTSLPHYHITEDKTVKTLGVLWNSETDCLEYSVQAFSQAERILFVTLDAIEGILMKKQLDLNSLLRINVKATDTALHSTYEFRQPTMATSGDDKIQL